MKIIHLEDEQVSTLWDSWDEYSGDLPEDVREVLGNVLEQTQRGGANDAPIVYVAHYGENEASQLVVPAPVAEAMADEKGWQVFMYLPLEEL